MYVINNYNILIHPSEGATERGVFMSTEFSVSLAKIIKEIALEPYFMPHSPEDIAITSMDIDRPGLELTGYLDFFDEKRIIIFGNTE